jgi:hypothetical protein
MTLTLISSTMMNTMHSKEESLVMFEGFCIIGFWEFFKNFFCILMEVNKTMYGNNEDVPKKILDNLYPESDIRDVTFAVV